MNSLQQSAFFAASGIQSDAMLLAIKSSLIVVLLLWSCWITLGTFRSWRLGDVELYDALWQVMRACIALLIVGFYIQ